MMKLSESLSKSESSTTYYPKSIKHTQWKSDSRVESKSSVTYDEVIREP